MIKAIIKRKWKSVSSVKFNINGPTFIQWITFKHSDAFNNNKLLVGGGAVRF